MPRKFNIAYDGGGLIGTVEDTNDIGAKAVRVGKEILFRIALGGATGHKAFANDLGVLVSPKELNRVITSIVRVFIANGNRGDRKKARLKHLLETWTLDQYLVETEKELGYTLGVRRRAGGDYVSQPGYSALAHRRLCPKAGWLNYIGVAMPVGQITPKQMIRARGDGRSLRLR